MPTGRALLVNGRQQAGAGGLLNPGSRLVADVGTIDEDFIRTMTADARATTGPTLDALALDKSDIRMFKVLISRGLTNLTIRGARR